MKVHTHNIISNQSGNALWFILLAVALFGILTATVSSNMSQVEQTGSKEQNRIKALALIRYAKEIEAGVQRMYLNGVSENDLDFVQMNATYNNPNCNSDECDVFAVSGGGVQLRAPEDILGNAASSTDWQLTDDNRVYRLGCDEHSFDCTELLLLIKHIPTAICLEVNSALGIENPSGDAPQMIGIQEGAGFTGAYNAANSYILGGPNVTQEAPQLSGKSTGCFYEYGGGQNQYFFYQVLTER